MVSLTPDEWHLVSFALEGHRQQLATMLHLSDIGSDVRERTATLASATKKIQQLAPEA